MSIMVRVPGMDKFFCLLAILFAGTALAEDLPKTITNSIGMELVLIPAGEFDMGSTEKSDNAYPQHRVRISKPFFFGKTEVTQGEWQRFMGTQPWDSDAIKEGAHNPASQIDWELAVNFCKFLSETEGKRYRLPTEGEWEYACRASTKTDFSFDNDVASLSDYAWWGGLFGKGNIKNEQSAHEVGRKKPNPWGLYDMHGNVSEWCSDWFNPSYYETSLTIDPKGPDTGKRRVVRGGGWIDSADSCRSFNRNGVPPSEFSDHVGFRVVLEIDASK